MNLVTRFTGLYQSETLVDVTLAAEGKHLQVSCVAIICPIDNFSKTKNCTKGCLSLFNYFIDMSPTLMSPFFVKKTCFFNKNGLINAVYQMI